MNPYEKVVKLACKPKAIPPKYKYVDPLVAATFSEDGAIRSVFAALAPRFKESNNLVVSKALILLHTLIRNGDTDNVLQYLSQFDVLRLRNVGNERWDGLPPPPNFVKYAQYLDERVRAYRDLNYDPIRVQSENNRYDRRAEDRAQSSRRDSRDSSRRTDPSLAPRQQAREARGLRVLTVEKGLLREIKIVQKVMDVGLGCRFYFDDLEDELAITAFRMLVKDLLFLFQAVNEGVINLLENYFEMSKLDATTALNIYRHFCAQVPSVVEYLGIAKKLQNLLNVPIPNLRHAPVSLAGSLEEYLNDPYFEQNRIEYKANNASADRRPREERASERNRHVPNTSVQIPPRPRLDPPERQLATTTVATSSQPLAQGIHQELIDFFASLELDQAGAPVETQPQEVLNPFAPAQVPVAPGFHPEAQPRMVSNPFVPTQLATGTGFPGAPPFVDAAGASGSNTVQATGFPGVSQAPSSFFNMQPQPASIPGWMTSGINPTQPPPTGTAFLASNEIGLSLFASPRPAAPDISQANTADGQHPLDARAQKVTNPFRAQVPMTNGLAAMPPVGNAAGTLPFMRVQDTEFGGAPG